MKSAPPIGMRWLFVLLPMPLLFAIGWMLPSSAGWENGPIEMVQNVMIFSAMCISFGMAYVRREQRTFWLAFALIWFLLLGRELSWGAVWGSPLSSTPEGGPFFSSRTLPYRTYLTAARALVLIIIVALFWCADLRKIISIAWRQRTRFPLLSVCAVFLYAAIVWLVESPPVECLHGMLIGHDQVLEELFETVVYGAALVTQCYTFARWLKID